MQVWNVLHAGRWKCRKQKWRKNRHLRTIVQLCRAASSQPSHVSTIEKNVKQQYFLHMSPQYGVLGPTSGWDLLASLKHTALMMLWENNRSLLIMAALCNMAGQAIIFLPCRFLFYLSIFLLFFLAYSQPSQIGCLPYFHTWCGLSSNLGCWSETCCTRLAENTGRKKSPINRHLGTIAQFRPSISLQLRHVSPIGKKTC